MLLRCVAVVIGRGWEYPVSHWQFAAKPGERQRILIEATRDATGREWFPVNVCPSEARTALVSYWLQNSKRGFDGRLRFRVVPTKLVGP